MTLESAHDENALWKVWRTNKHWILPSADDPRNADLADWAETIAIIEWLLIFFAAAAPMPTDAPVVPFHAILLIVALSLVLLFAGYRGFIIGTAKSLGSLVLVTTNLFIFLTFAILIVGSYCQFINQP